MKRNPPPRIPCWVLECVLPVSYQEMMLGDLIEEYAVVSQSHSPWMARVWFWSQACRSVPPVMWSMLRRGDWSTRLLTAIAVYASMAMLKLTASVVIIGWISPSQDAGVVLAPIEFVLITAIGGCVLSRIRPDAIIFLALFVMISVLVLIAVRICTIPVPWWYQCAFLTLGPLSVLIAPAIVRALRPPGWGAR
jgi:hypothetical protein